MEIKKLSKAQFFELRQTKEPGFYFNKVTIRGKVKFIAIYSDGKSIEEKPFNKISEARTWLNDKYIESCKN